MPTIEELREIYADVLDDEAIHAVSRWREKYYDDKYSPADEEDYVARAEKDGEDCVEIMRRVAASLA